MPSRGFVRYLLWQLPGWAGAALLLLWLHSVAGVPAWAAITLFGAFVLKDLTLFPFMRHTVVPPRRDLVGLRGHAVERLAPAGYVRVQGELWRAEAPVEIAPGDAVVVREMRGLTLRVDPAPPHDH